MTLPGQTYWAHYNRETGIIRCVSNEVTMFDEGSAEISYEEFRQFVTAEKKMHEHIIGFAKGTDGKTKKTIIPIADQLFGFRNHIFEWINDPPADDTELVVTWNGTEKTWNFKLSDSAKTRIKKEVMHKTIFFVMLKNDFDFLIRNIIFDVKDLVKLESITVPFESNIESKIEKISVATQILFHNYGLIIND